MDYLPTASEREALVLEQTLIKQLQPHFNTMWRDDKTYPFVENYQRRFSSGGFFSRAKWLKDRLRLISALIPNVRQIRKSAALLLEEKFFPAAALARYDF